MNNLPNLLLQLCSCTAAISVMCDRHERPHSLTWTFVRVSSHGVWVEHGTLSRPLPCWAHDTDEDLLVPFAFVIPTFQAG